MREWRKVCLGEVAREVTVGFVGSMAQEYQTCGVPFLRSQNVRPHHIDTEDMKFINREFHAHLKKSSLVPGDVVTVRTGTPGQSAVVPNWLEIANCSDLVITRPGPELDARWLSYYLNWVTETHISGRLVGAVQQHFNVKSAQQLELILPSFEEQQAIAEVLGALDDKIAANYRIANLTREFLGAEFARMRVVDSSAPMVDSTTLGDMVEMNPKLQSPDSTKAVHLEMKNLPDQGMTATDWGCRPARGGARFQNGDTLLARITPCLENGKVGYVDFLEEGEVGIGSTEFIVMRPRLGVPPVLPYFVATTTKFRDFAIKHMTGTSGRQRLAATDLVEYPLYRPDAKELARFESLSSALMERVKAAVDESRKLSATRDELLPLLMAGKVRVRDAEKVVEGVV